MGGAAAVLSACGVGAMQPTIGADGRPLPRVYKIDKATAAAIPYRVLDSINTLRAAKGAAPLALNAELTAAAVRPPWLE
jgi:uncharacterized protein YkwD